MQVVSISLLFHENINFAFIQVLHQAVVICSKPENIIYLFDVLCGCTLVLNAAPAETAGRSPSSVGVGEVTAG